MNRSYRALLTLTTATLLPLGALEAKTIHVNPGQSIQAAIADSNTLDGDEIVVAPGTYNELIDFKGKAITVRGSGGAASTIISGDTLSGSVVTFKTNESPAACLMDICVTKGSGTLTGAIESVAGGGIFIEGSSPTILDCIVADNHLSGSNNMGGGVFVASGNPILRGCTIKINSTSNGVGGGFGSSGGGALVENTVFFGNQAKKGAAVGSWSPLAIVNCTMAANQATDSGGAVFFDFAPSSADPNLRRIENSILWSNTPDQIMAIAPLTVSYSDVQGGFTGSNIAGDPMFVNATANDYRPAAGSPCVDAGDNQAVMVGVTTDLSGGPRFCDDPNTSDTGNPDGSNPIVDMGAHEYGHAMVTDLGLGLAGLNGTPVLGLSGGACPGEAIALSLTNARSNAATIFVLGASRIDLPALGGTLVPSPDVLLYGLSTDAAGEMAFAGSLDPTLVPAVVYLQFWVQDAAAPAGYAASNGVKLDVQ